MENSKNSSLSKLIPVMLCFFAMGFVDLVGIASNYVKADLGLSDSQANIFPSLVFFWFLIYELSESQAARQAVTTHDIGEQRVQRSLHQRISDSQQREGNQHQHITVTKNRQQ